MKIILAIIVIVIAGVLILGLLFLRWANSPEQVRELQKSRRESTNKKAADVQRNVEAAKEYEVKQANLKLVIDENFADNQFKFLDYKYADSFFKFEKNEFNYSVSVYKGQNPDDFFIFSKEDFGDFAAEINFDIWGRVAKTGIFWDAQPNGDRQPSNFHIAYSSPNGLDVKSDDASENYNLGSFLESATTQKLRVERFGEHLTVSVNDKTFFDQEVQSAGQGRVGIYLGNRGGIDDDRQSIIVIIKNFKVWR